MSEPVGGQSAQCEHCPDPLTYRLFSGSMCWMHIFPTDWPEQNGRAYALACRRPYRTFLATPKGGQQSCPTCERPYAVEQERHAARNSDPESSHQAVRTRAPGWKTMNGIALRIFGSRPGGLTFYEVEQIATRHLGPGALGKSPWKRCSELHTAWKPPLLAPVLDEHGAQLMRAGEFPDPVGIWDLTDEGRAFLATMRNRNGQT